MPLCYFQSRESAHDQRVLGWIDPDASTIVALSGSLSELLRPNRRERVSRVRSERAAAQISFRLDDVILRAPVDDQEIWAAGVTYERSRDARMEESTQEDIYDRVYTAERPEIFFKAPGWRCAGPYDPIGIRPDSTWDVPEPELALVIDAHGEIAGYTIGNDVSSRSIEGENPLYLSQAKIYTASCALGPWISLSDELPDPLSLGVRIRIERNGAQHWSGATSTSLICRPLDTLVAALCAALDFPHGSILLTGTGVIPPSEFTLENGDTVTIEIDGLGSLVNSVYRLAPR